MHPPRVLYVDDDPRIIQALLVALRREPYQVLGAHSALEALEVLERGPADVLISDEQMPGMRGSDLLARVRERWPDTVRMMVTGQATLESALRAINQGEVYRFFIKPASHLDLAVTIRHAIRQRALTLACRKLVQRTEAQARVLQRLERAHPGITAVERDGAGAVVVDPATDDLGEILRMLGPGPKIES